MIDYNNVSPRFIFLSPFFIYIWGLPQFIIFWVLRALSCIYVSVYVCIYDERLRCSKIRQWNDPSIFCIMPPLLGQEFLIDSTFNVFLCAGCFSFWMEIIAWWAMRKRKTMTAKFQDFVSHLSIHIVPILIAVFVLEEKMIFFALELRKIYCKNI